jgi:hypothetical protein
MSVQLFDEVRQGVAIEVVAKLSSTIDESANQMFKSLILKEDIHQF